MDQWVRVRSHLNSWLQKTRDIRSFKVTQTGTRKPICDYLLAANSNLIATLSTISEILWPKLQKSLFLLNQLSFNGLAQTDLGSLRAATWNLATKNYTPWATTCENIVSKKKTKIADLCIKLPFKGCHLWIYASSICIGTIYEHGAPFWWWQHQPRLSSFSFTQKKVIRGHENSDQSKAHTRFST